MLIPYEEEPVPMLIPRRKGTKRNRFLCSSHGRGTGSYVDPTGKKLRGTGSYVEPT
jgi:hypothetical protein